MADPYLPLDQCQKGTAYRLWSRNLAIGVFNGETGFIGIRKKFGDRYLFTEYHWDTGPPHGTAKPKDIIAPAPPEIVLREDIGTKCQRCGQPIEFAFDEGKATGRWYRLDKTRCEGLTGLDDRDCEPCSTPNKTLFDWLDSLEAKP